MVHSRRVTVARARPRASRSPADPKRAAAQSSSSNSLKLLREDRERLSEGLRAVKADGIADTPAAAGIAATAAG